MKHTTTTVNGQEYRAIEALGSELEDLGYYDVDLQGEDYHGSFDVEGYVAHVIGEPVDCEVVSEEPVGKYHEDTRLMIVYGEARLTYWVGSGPYAVRYCAHTHERADYCECDECEGFYRASKTQKFPVRPQPVFGEVAA